MATLQRKLFSFIVGLLFIFPLTISTLAAPVTPYSTGQYNFYSDWMSPRVEPMESKVLFVSEYAKRDLPPREEKVQVSASAPVTPYSTGQYNFYSDWMSPRVEPMETRTLFN